MRESGDGKREKREGNERMSGVKMDNRIIQYKKDGLERYRMKQNKKDEEDK